MGGGAETKNGLFLNNREFSVPLVYVEVVFEPLPFSGVRIRSPNDPPPPPTYPWGLPGVPAVTFLAPRRLPDQASPEAKGPHNLSIHLAVFHSPPTTHPPPLTTHYEENKSANRAWLKKYLDPPPSTKPLQRSLKPRGGPLYIGDYYTQPSLLLLF